MSWPSHGSNPQYIYQFLQLNVPKEMIDFSVNLNPFGPPNSIQQKWPSWMRAIEDYPDPFGDRLITLISSHEDIPKEFILLGNGGAELIQLIANLFRKKRVLLIQPTFSEYEKMCRAYDCDITYFVLEEDKWDISIDLLEQELKHHDVVFLCHPNNPTGITYSESFLLQIIEASHTHRCYIVIDEAFYDFLSKPITMVTYIKDYEQLIIIRSLTKMYSIAGLRLGYLLANPQITEALSKFQPHWSVNALALLAGEESLLHQEYVIKTRDYFSNERKRIISFLRNTGYLISNSKVNFYLLRDPELDKQLPLFIFLLKKGLVPRHTANYPGLNGNWLRFAIRKKEENNILLEALIEWKNN